jgi:gamma-glutamyltranspeptidase / glutathione hydrolase
VQFISFRRTLILTALVSVAIALICPSTAHAAPPTPAHASHGMVVSASDFASEAGIAILKAGGNAFDAAAVVGFTLAVTHPQAGNIGGGGFLVAVKENGDPITLDFRETAPAAASRDMYLDAQGNVVDGLSLRSSLASGVPGSVDGLLRVWRDHGSGQISRELLLTRAIELAEKGFPISGPLATALNSKQQEFAADPGASAIFLNPLGRPWQAGDSLVQRDLAATLTRISKEGAAGFYRGKTAALLAHQHQRTQGLITEADLAAYRSTYRKPITGTFRDYEIVSMGPPSSGGILLVQMLNMLEPYDLHSLGWNTADSVHLLTEVQRRAYADRAEFLGDSDFIRIPTRNLTSKDYALHRASDISMTAATPSADIGAGKPWPKESLETTHYSVADSSGNAVSVTTTLNTGFGSCIVIEGAGFLMNNEMDDFSAKPGTPNAYGLVGNAANAIAPGKRMLSSMTPTIVLKDSKPYLVLGSPGGSTIITTVLQNFLNVAIHGMDIQAAISAPRHHSQWLPDRVVYEAGALKPEVLSALRARGHETKEVASIGQANAIMITSEGLWGGPDTRSDNAAAGY